MKMTDSIVPVHEINDPEDAFPIIGSAIVDGMMSVQVDGAFADLTLEDAENMAYDWLSAIYTKRMEDVN